MSDEELMTDDRQLHPQEDGEQLFSAPGLDIGEADTPSQLLLTVKGVTADMLYQRGSILPPSAEQKRKPVISESAQFAPPPKFSYPMREQQPRSATPMEGEFAEPIKMNYAHEPLFFAQSAAPLPSDTLHQHYDVDAEPQPPKARKKGRGKRVLLGALIATVALGSAGVLLREPISAYLTQWTGQSDTREAAGALVAYDPAAAIDPGEKVLSAIRHLTGGLPLEPYAVTQEAIIRRMPREDGRADYYLFSAQGLLLGYYENLPKDGFQVLEGGAFYVAESPYLIGSAGLPLVRPENYLAYTDTEPVIGPLQHGWAVVSNEEKTTFNYINASGDLLSSVWFARAIPFRGSHTVAYVDTGNLQTPDERYTLYLLDDKGGIQRLSRTASMDDVTDAACGMLLRSTGELCTLADPETPLCTASDVTAYLDISLMVARDAETGLCRLYRNGMPVDDAAYDSVEPVACELQWGTHGTPPFVLRAVEGAAYPQPLAHYFMLTAGGRSETVAFATDSVCPIRCE